MKISRLLRPLALFSAALAGAAANRAAPPGPRPPLDIINSSGDSWWMGNAWLPVDSPGAIRDSVQMWADVLNVKRVYWRGQQEEMMFQFGLVRKENLKWHDFFEIWERHLIDDLHLNQVMTEEAHRHGMEVYFWAPLLDYGGPADTGGTVEYPYSIQLNLTIRHPEWMPVNRWGTRAENGPIELAYPEARKELIKMYLYYVERDKLDGISFFTYCENYGQRFEDEFGYNQPIVDEFKRRYGVDIRTERFDKHLWRYLRGEYVTRFLRELGAALHARGKKMGVRLNPREPNFPERWYVSPYALPTGRIYLDWERWVRERIVDELIVSSAAPHELQDRTIENVLDATRGIPVSVSTNTSKPFSPRFQPYVARGMRLMMSARDDASYIRPVYPVQSAAALAGSDMYAAIRFLSQVAQGESTAELGAIRPWVKHPNILVRRQALKALAKIKSPESVAILEDALDDRESSVRSAAIFALLENHGPESVDKMIAVAKRDHTFQAFEAVSNVLTAMEPKFLPAVLKLADDLDVQLRRMCLYVLGGRRDEVGLASLVAGLRDPDQLVRFRAAQGLQRFRSHPEAVEALLRALQDPDVIIQNRAAISLAMLTMAGSNRDPRRGLEAESITLLRTPVGPLAEIRLNRVQERVLRALAGKFHEFGDASTRSDLSWGFRPVGNAILAFGAAGGRDLQAMIDQKQDRRLSELAWQVLNIRQGIENYCLVPDAEDEDARIWATYPTRHIQTISGLPLNYDPFE